MNVTEGHTIYRAMHLQTDAVIVGSGPAGASVARVLSRAGLDVIVLDEGPYVRPAQFPEDGFGAMARMYRGMGATMSQGNPMMPLVQGRVIGGTSVINGAISWRLPRDVYEEWVAADPELGEAISWHDLASLFDQIEEELNIHPTEESIAGPNNLLLKKGADALGLKNRPISRNVQGCEGLGRCLQGCPKGNKMSMERTYLPEANEHGAKIFSEVRVRKVRHKRGKATGIVGIASGGGKVEIDARKAVVLAASCIQSPALLLRSGIRQGPVGRGFQCHPGASLSGRFASPVRLWTGATQGHEVIGLRKEGIKFEALGYDMSMVATRLKGVGKTLMHDIEDMGHQAHWGAAIRAQSRGRVRQLLGRAVVSLHLSRSDMEKVRRGVAIMGQMMLAAGAEYVEPGVYGWDTRVKTIAEMKRFEQEATLDPRHYMMAVTHMFGTCAMGSDPRAAVVRPDFRHHHVANLYVADSSVFPTSIGVNPQTSIIAMATLCGRRIAAAS